MTRERKPPPLSGICILEWGGQEASLAGRILAGLGAEVWRVEPAASHPDCHQTAETPDIGASSASLTFTFLHSGKRAVRLPTDEKEVQAWLIRAIRAADAMITSPCEHFRPHHEAAVKAAMLLAGHRVWIRIDPYEHTPNGSHPTAPADELHAPFPTSLPLLTALRAASSCLLGLLQKGAVYEEALHSEAVLGQIIDLLFGDSRVHTGYWDNAFALLPTRDGWVSATILGNWSALAHAIYDSGGPAWIVRETLEDPASRYRHAREIFEVVARWCRSWPSRALTAWAQLRRIPFAAVRSPLQLASDAHLRQRKFFLHSSSRRGAAPLRHPRVPILFRGCGIPGPTPPPATSQDLPSEHGRGSLEEAQHPSVSGPPLESIKVLDFTHAIAGPLATWLLRHYGAEVIKIDPPGLTQAKPIHAGTFTRLRAGKKALEVDAETRQGRAQLLDLVRQADLVIDNFSVRVMKNWELDYQRLRAINPRILQLRITGFGLTGPLRHWVAYAHTLHAWSGHTWLGGQLAEGRALSDAWPIPYADIVSGLFAFLASLVSLWHREKASFGTLIDVSEYECATFALGPILLAVANPRAWADHLSDFQHPAFEKAVAPARVSLR